MREARAPGYADMPPGVRAGHEEDWLKRISLVAMVSFAAVAMTLAACGGDDDDAGAKDTASPAATSAASTNDKTGAGTNASPAASASANAQPAASASSGSSGSGSGSSGSGGGQITGAGADALKKLYKDLSQVTFQASYEMSIKSSNGEQKGTLVLVNKPPKTAYVYQIDANGQKTDLAIINDGKTTMFCTKMGTEGQCIKSKSDSSLFSNPFSIEEMAKNLDQDIKVTQLPDENVGGVASKCFTTDQAGSKGKACFSKADGILTLIEGGGDNTSLSVKATKVTKNTVDDKLLDAPAGYKVIEQP